MRHVYIRGILAVLWLAVGIVSGMVFYFVLGGVFFYSSYTMWKKEKNNRGGR